MKRALLALSLLLVSCTLHPINDPRPSPPPLPQSAFMSPLGTVPPKVHRILLHPNRKTQADFLCISCGNSANADTNAAKNISVLGRAVYVNQPHVSESVQSTAR